MTGIEIGVIAGTAVTAGDAMMVASAVMGAANMMSQGAQASATANYNAGVAGVEAINAQNAAAYEEKLHRERGQSLLAAQRAAVGASGVGLEGSSLLALEESAQALEKDALAIRYSGSVAAARARSQAAADRVSARAAKTAGMWGAGKSLLSGASKVGWSPAPAGADE
jgi:hypothetical protein